MYEKRSDSAIREYLAGLSGDPEKKADMNRRFVAIRQRSGKRR